MIDLASSKGARADLLTGAIGGALLWLEVVAIGLPKIAIGTPGYDAIPVAVIAGALVGATRGRRALNAIVILLGVVLAIVAYTPITRALTRPLVRSDQPVPATDAIVVLSGGVTADAHLKPSAADRLLTALSLVRRGVASTLLVSRERWRYGDREVTTDVDQQRLIALVERQVRLLIVDSVASTRDEAVRMRRLASAVGISRIALVTSPTHTRRACSTFEAVGFVVACVPSESRDVALATQETARDRVLAFQLVLYEWVALARYRLARWL